MGANEGGFLVLTRMGQSVEVYDVLTGAVRAGPFRHAGLVTAAAVSPDGTRLAVATSDGTAFLWDVAAVHPAANHAPG